MVDLESGLDGPLSKFIRRSMADKTVDVVDGLIRTTVEKLMMVHLNDQNGIKYDQDKSSGVENLRTAFNQVKVLRENGYGGHGGYIGLDVKAMRTAKNGDSYRHPENGLNIFRALEKKAGRFD